MRGLLTLTNKIRTQVINTIYKLTQSRGVEAKVFFPQQSNSKYNSEDSDYEYNEVPDWTGTLLFTGILAEGQETSEMDMILSEIDDRKIIVNIDYDSFLSDKELKTINGVPQRNDNGDYIYVDSNGTEFYKTPKEYVFKFPENSMIIAKLSDDESIGARFKLDTVSQSANKLYLIYSIVPME